MFLKPLYSTRQYERKIKTNPSFYVHVSWFGLISVIRGRRYPQIHALGKAGGNGKGREMGLDEKKQWQQAKEKKKPQLSFLNIVA